MKGIQNYYTKGRRLSCSGCRTKDKRRWSQYCKMWK